MRAVVVGGAGFVGSHLVERLVATGENVHVLDDLSTGRIQNLGPARRLGQVGFHTLSIDNPQFIEALIRLEPDIIYHMAMPTPPDRGEADPLGAALDPLRHVAPIAQAASVTGSRVVLAVNATDLYGAMTHLPVAETQRPLPMHTHGAALYAALRFVEARVPRRWVGMALGEVYGPRQEPTRAVFARMIQAAALGRVPIVPTDDEVALDYVYVADVSDALARAATQGTGLINIASGVATSFGELMSIVSRVTGYQGPTKEANLRVPLPAELSLDCATPRVHLGWKSSTPLEEGIRYAVEAFRS